MSYIWSKHRSDVVELISVVCIHRTKHTELSTENIHFIKYIASNMTKSRNNKVN